MITILSIASIAGILGVVSGFLGLLLYNKSDVRTLIRSDALIAASLPLLAYAAVAFVTLSAFLDSDANRNSLIAAAIFTLIGVSNFRENKRNRLSET